MSWSLRDYKNASQDSPDALPPPVFHDDEPLPTYMAGLESYEEDAPAPLSWRERQEMRRQGYLTEAQMDRWAQIVKRGVVEM